MVDQYLVQAERELEGGDPGLPRAIRGIVDALGPVAPTQRFGRNHSFRGNRLGLQHVTGRILFFSIVWKLMGQDANQRCVLNEHHYFLEEAHLGNQKVVLAIH